jgi:hypothetical protein
MNAQVEHDDDAPMVHKPMSGLGAALFGLGTAYAASERAYAVGSPEAIADCQRRQREAQQKAHDALAQAATEQAGEYDPTDDDGFTA